MDELARRLASGPGNFPHSLDPAKDMILLVALSEAEIGQASFLDQRVLTPQTWGRWWPIRDVEQRFDPGTRDDAHYIFHISHVGSTLISRLIGASNGVLALREPLVLRDLANILATGDRLGPPWNDIAIRRSRALMVRRLLARTFRADQRAIVKATSFVSDIATDLVAPDARALLLFTSLPSYAATILAGENSRHELSSTTVTRLTRLARRLGSMPCELDSLGEGERIALGWTTEMLALHEAADALPAGAALWLDFDDFLAKPLEGMMAISSHFDLQLLPTDAARIVNGPLMQRYSKAPEYSYSAALRLQLQRQAARDHENSFRRATAWFEETVRQHPRLASIAMRASRLG